MTRSPPAAGRSATPAPSANGSRRRPAGTAANVLLLDDLGEVDPGLAGSRGRRPAADQGEPRLGVSHVARGSGARRRSIVVFFAGHASRCRRAQPTTAGRPPARRSSAPHRCATSSQCERTGWRLDEAIDPWASTGRNPIVCWLDTSLHGRGRRLPPAGGADRVRAARRRRHSCRASSAGRASPPGSPPTAGPPPRRPRRASSARSPPRSAAGARHPRAARQPACLSRRALRRTPRCADQGFRMLGGIDPNLTLWSSQARRRGLAQRELLLQRGHAGGITALAYTADGDRLITAAQDSTIKVWRVVRPDRAPRRLRAHLVGVTCLDVSPDGRWLASGDGSGRLRPARPRPRRRGPDRAGPRARRRLRRVSAAMASTWSRSTSTARAGSGRPPTQPPG